MAPSLKEDELQPTEYLTIEDAARMLRVSRQRAYQMFHAGRLPGHQDVKNGRIQIDPDAWEAWRRARAEAALERLR